MKDRITKKAFFFTALVISLVAMQGCSDDNTTTTPEGSGQSSNPRVRITEVNPRFLRGNSNDSFTVKCNLYDIEGSSYNLHLAVRKHQLSACDAWQKDTTIESSTGSCVIPPAVLRISVWVEIENNVTVRDSAYYQWGSPSVGNTNTVSIERFRMPFVTRGVSDSIANCIIRSFNPSDSNLVKVPISFDPLRNLPNDSNFVFYSDQDLLNQLNNYSSIYDSNISINRKIYFARSQSYLLGLLGASNYSNFDSENWSFVFKKNIDSLYPPSLYNDTSIANLIAVHELLHQLGRISNEGHDFHLGWFAQAPNRCAMYSGDVSGLWPDLVRRGTYTGRFRICTHHAMQLRTFLGFIPELPGGNWISASGQSAQPIFDYPSDVKNFASGKYSMKMSLGRQEYKKFEPVIAKFELINNDSQPMEVYNLFEKSSDEPALTVTKESGASDNKNKGRIGFIVPWLHTVIEPGDTLIISMPLNNWGVQANKPEDRLTDKSNIYFDQFGFFEPGGYKAYFYFNESNVQRYSAILQSNEVNFTVTKLTDEDNEILKLYQQLWKQRRLDELASLYPNSSFGEYIDAERLLAAHSDNISESTIVDYNQFITKYPSSYYLFDWNFMRPFLKSVAEFHGGQSSGINYLKNTHSSDVLNQVLNNAAFLRGIFPDFEKQK